MRVRQWRVDLGWWLDLHKQKASGDYARKVVPVTYLPDDAEVVRVGHDYTGWLVFIIQSATFDDIKEGNAIPLLTDPVLTVVVDDVPIKASKVAVRKLRRAQRR